ncbi:glycosyltransferase [Bosea psychrotolerans]|uniref:Glycosyl transferase family 2 n=1 Tax=Bosea psychrotolerans TaxID=1871628 RepID=A0A2S4LY48_9HYPH|nr:glycosyltransferase [Bosea psychrotolerans]POR47338.1 glycosyl transferase family 2 [Bosea psychrotolerans]
MRQDQNLGTTVLLPVYFEEPGTENLRLLRRSIESIRDQRFPGAYETLIVDDGSPVPIASLSSRIGSPALLQEVRFVRAGRNGGLVHALNRGLASSRHPYIARLDADDKWLPGKIEKQFEQFLQDPDLTISATGMTLVTPAGKPLETHVRPGDWNGILNFFVEIGCPFPHGSVLARRDIYQLLGGYSHDPRTAHCEDYALWGLWLRFFKPAMVEEALYDYTVHARSVSALNGLQQQSGSTLVRETFRAVDAVDTVPGALQALAKAVGVTMLQAGILAYRMWRYRLTVWLPRGALEALALLMPDRDVSAAGSGDHRAITWEQVLAQPPSNGALGEVAVRAA